MKEEPRSYLLINLKIFTVFYVQDTVIAAIDKECYIDQVTVLVT